jgi:hypothetical protein
VDRRGTRPHGEGGEAPGTGGWAGTQVKLLGTDHDEMIAERIGKTVGAVRVKRVRLKIPAFRDRRRSSVTCGE